MSPVFVGVIFHWLGGLAAASFYIPYGRIKRWSWETFWLAGGFFSWIIAPMCFAALLVPHVFSLIGATPLPILGWAFFFGMLWGVGNLMFGMTMRYLGIALGYAIALGLCVVFGTLMPPIFSGEISKIASSDSGQMVLLGIGVCLLGIITSAVAGWSKERELTGEQKSAAIKEFNFIKGLAVAIGAGVLSACFAYGLAAGKPLAEQARQMLVQQGKLELWQNLPVLIVVLWGGFTTNFLWCFFLNLKRKSYGEYFGQLRKEESGNSQPVSMLGNYALATLGGVLWYLQFFFYSMGQTKMGKYDFSSWTLHMASIIIFSTLWGMILREWKGTSKRTHVLIALGLLILIGSTIVVGYGNYLGAVK